MSASINVCFELELSLDEGLAEFLNGKLNRVVGKFKKNKQEAYPPEVPIPLKDSYGTTLAEVEVISFTVSHNRTEGNYKVNRYFSAMSKEYGSYKSAMNSLLSSSVIDCI